MISEIKAFFRSFAYAAAGVLHCVRTQRNMRFHLCAAVTAAILSAVCGLSVTEECIVFLCIGAVISSELMNTAAEAAADMHGEKKTPLAKAVKDCAAGAVLISAAAALICGIKLFFTEERLHAAAVFAAAHPAAAVLWAAAAFLFIFSKRKG